MLKKLWSSRLIWLVQLVIFFKFAYRRQLIKYRCRVILGTSRISKRSSSWTMHLVLPLFSESPFLMFYFPLFSCQLILSPPLLLSSISFISKARIHDSTKLSNRLSCLSISFNLHRCKFMGILDNNEMHW